MRERAAVEAVIHAIVASIVDQQPCRVEVVRLRRSTSCSDRAVRHWFQIVATGTPLEGARLAIEIVNRIVECACGRSRTIAVEDLLGHVWVCSVCRHVEEIDPLDDLELLDVLLTPLESAPPVPAVSR